MLRQIGGLSTHFHHFMTQTSTKTTGRPNRKIIHIDMDAFFASVEQRNNPSLKGKPVIVGGTPEGRGVVASASYEARKLGVKSAMSAAVAKRLCPQAIFVKPDFGAYKEASQTIHKIFQEVTDLIEPLSLDEAYLDVTENKPQEPLAKKLAEYLKARILGQTGLTASAGAGPNKFIAKVASDIRKPNGLVVVPPERILDFVAPLPVERLWGVGPATAKVLHEMAIFKAEDIRKRTPEELEHALGKFGRFIYHLSFGEDDRPVEADWERKSLGTETTFHRDVTDIQKLLDKLEEQSKEISEDLTRIERRGKTISLKIRYSDFSTITRSKTLSRYTDSATEIFQTAIALLQSSTEAGIRPVRLIGMNVSSFLSPDEPEQLWLDFQSNEL